MTKLILGFALALPAMTAVMMPMPAAAVCTYMCDESKYRSTTTCVTVKSDRNYVTKCTTTSK